MNAALFNQGCLGVVLAGGKSSRMGSNKALLMRNKIAVNGKENMLSFSKAKIMLLINLQNLALWGVFTVLLKNTNLNHY
jgi:CTP:molybdopterin cytidylyltransferase MocA